MKRTAFLFLLLSMLAFSCSKDGKLENLTGSDQVGIAAMAQGNVIEVNPGGDATASIIDAFDMAKSIGKGTVVKLMPGTYEIKMIEVREFFGTFTGSGEDVTIITNHPDLDPSVAVQQNKIPALLRFVGGEVNVSNMKISLTDLPGISQINMCTVIFTDYTSDFVPAKKYIRVKMNEVSMKGFLPLFNGNRGIIGVRLGTDFINATPPMPLVNLDADITNSNFSEFIFELNITGCKNGNINIGGGNHFEGSAMCLTTGDNVGINLKIHDNKFVGYDEGTDAIDLSSGTGMDFEKVEGNLGNYEVRNNVIDIAYYAIGFFDIWRIANPDDPRYMKVIVDRNLFTGSGSAIVTFANKNSLFSNNIFAAGDGWMGLDIYGLLWVAPDDPLYEYSLTEGCRFINNKFQRPVDASFEFDTRDNLMVGVLDNILLTDYGENNRFNDRKAPDPSGNANGHLKMYEDRIKLMKEILNK